MNLLPTSQNTLIFPRNAFPLFADLWLQRFPGQVFKSFSGAIRDVVGLHPSVSTCIHPQKILQTGVSLSRQRQSSPPLLAPAFGSRIHASDSDAALKAMSPKLLAAQPKKTQRPIQTQQGYFNCSNSASNLKSTLMSYKEVTKMCTAA